MSNRKESHFEWAHLVFSYPVSTPSADKTYRQAFKKLALILGRGNISSGEDALMAAQLQELNFSFLLEREGVDLVELFFDCRSVLPEQSTLIRAWHNSDQCHDCSDAYSYSLSLLKNRPKLEPWDILRLHLVADINFAMEWGVVALR